MSASRFLRPLMRAQPSVAARFVRPAAIAPMSTQANKQTRVSVPEEKLMKLQPVRNAMPQLVPFFFVNEVATAWILLPTMIYLFSKYLLPQKVRLFAARLFISKL